MRVYFDASVIIAAIISENGGSAKLLQFAGKQLIIGITSETIIDEVLDVNKTVKIKKSTKNIKNFINRSGLHVVEHISQQHISPILNKVHEEDAHMLTGAMLTKCKYLVTLDKKHILRNDVKKSFSPLKIVTPKELLEIIIHLQK